MSTRGTLRQDVINWTAHEGVGSGDMFNSILRVTEARIMRRVRTREQEVTTTLDILGPRTVLPTGFLRQRSLTLTDEQERSLEYLTPARLRESRYWDSRRSVSGPTAAAYTVEGGVLVIAPMEQVEREEDVLQVDFTYVAAFEPLAEPDDTNWLLQEAYDVYLFGCLAAASIYLEDERLSQEYEPRFERAVFELARSENRARVPSAAGLRAIGSPHAII